MTQQTMVAMESVSLVMLAVIGLAALIQPHMKDRTSRWFAVTLHSASIGIAMDIIAWSGELIEIPEVLHFWANMLSILGPCVTVSCFGYYITALICEKRDFKKNVAHIISFINLLACAITVFVGLRGKLFIVEGMVYNLTDWFIVSEVVAMGSMIVDALLGMINREYIGRNATIGIVTYCAIPLASSVIELLDASLLITYVAMSVSLVMIYVMLQSHHMSQVMLEEQILSEISHTDQLTGLLNRRAYDRDLQKLKGESSLGVVFCDLNGLKRVNDQKGHEAGDAYLKRFAVLLEEHFGHGCVYRISGDEFVVLVRDPQSDFDALIARFRNEINLQSGIAALGTICGPGETVMNLIREAEQEMYQDKKHFYRTNPRYRSEESEPV